MGQVRDRFAATAAYMLPAPLKKLAVRSAGDFAWFHYRQALALSLILGCVILAAGPALVVQAILVVWWETGVSRFRLGAALDSLFRAAGVAWALLWIAGVLRAIAGSTKPLPLTSRLQSSKAALRIAIALSAALWLLFGGAVFATAHSLRLARRDPEKPASVYILYDGAVARRWVFALGSYPLVLTAESRWGPGSTVIAPLTKKSLKAATANGRLVYLGTHGEEGGLIVGGRLLGPGELRKWVSSGEKLQFFYIAACHGGDAAPAWAEMFSPAKVVTFARNSAVLEHAAWFWLRAPRIAAGLR